MLLLLLLLLLLLSITANADLQIIEPTSPVREVTLYDTQSFKCRLTNIQDINAVSICCTGLGMALTKSPAVNLLETRFVSVQRLELKANWMLWIFIFLLIN